MSVIDEIKARLDIIDVVSSYISLKRTGRTHKALCPFHSERTPSFVVFEESQSWRCFGACNEGGDLFSFVKKIEGWDFRETLNHLAQKAGVELEPFTPEKQAQQNDDERLLRLLEAAARLYMEQLLELPEAERVRAYVFEKRGLTEDTIRLFQLGYAPDDWNFALNYFRMHGYSTQDILAVGLASENERGKIYDRFRHRLMIPIRNGQGQTLGFGARALADDQEPKYLNSPQGQLFDKSQLVYALDLARRNIRETETVVVTEGYMDVIQAHQAGYTNVVAQMGTALTEAQVRQLARYASRIVLALDTDAAGMRATMRGLDVMRASLTEAGSHAKTIFDAHSMMQTAGKLALDVRVLRLPEGKDPDEFIRIAPSQWPHLVEKATSLVDYVIDAGTHQLSPVATIQEREQVARTLLPLLNATENDLYRYQNIQRLAVRLRITENTLLNWMGTQKATNAQRSPRLQSQKLTNGNIPRGVLKQNRPERYLLSLLLRKPDWLYATNRKLRELAALDPIAAPLLVPLNYQDFSREDYRVLFELIETAQYEETGEDFIMHKAPPEIMSLIDEIFQESRLETLRFTTPAPLNGVEFESILKEHRRFDDETDREFQAFMFTILNLRLERLKRERNELDYVMRLGDYAEETSVDQQRVYTYARAQRLLEQAKRDLSMRRELL